jgi:aminopeptidase N
MLCVSHEMNKASTLGTLFGCVCLLPAVSLFARSEDVISLECRKSSAFLAPIDSPDYRKYAPDREVQIVHLALDVTPEFKNRTVEGKAVWTLKPISKPVTELKLDAVELSIHEVASSEKINAYEATDEKLTVTFAEPIAAGKEVTLTVTWSAEPTQGLYFRTPEMGYKEGDTHLFTQGEEIEARHWYPCFDSPNMKFTSEITCRLPEGMTAISNGRLVSESKDPASGKTVVHWSQEKPHSNYLISLVAGFFKKLEDKYKDIPIAFYTPPSEIKEAANSFRDTKDMLAFFEQEIGVDYPWPKYDQTCVNDFVEGGMENTSCTTLTDSTLFTDATENIRTSEGLISHEMAHQWFGDLVTCKDWSHIWLNESFATYYETLYNEHKNGRDSMLYELYGRTRQITGITNNFKAIVRRNFDSSHEMFDYLAYPKGGWVLHILRSQLGPELYRQCIKTYLERHLYGNVVTDDLRAVVEELSGRSFDQFFDQWIYHGYHPELDLNYSWDEKNKLAKLSVRQTQKVSEDVALFNLPVTVRFKAKAGTADRQIKVKQKEEDFYFPLDAAPEIVRFDPEYTLLAKVTFRVPAAMLHAQLGEKDDMIGRLLAIEQLSEKKDKESVGWLKETLNNDRFYGVRIEAARALRLIHTDEALDALLASTKQSDGRARRAVVVEIGRFYQDTAYAAALNTVKSEKNPDILSPAITSLAGYAKPEVHDTLMKFLNSDSFHNELADAAVIAIRSQDDPAYIAPLEEALSKRATFFTSRGTGSGLSTLAYIARNEEKKQAVREFLLPYVSDKRERIQLAAISALGTLGDPKAIAMLEKFTMASKETPQGRTAERAVETLRTDRKPVDDFKNLRQEVMDLQKTNRALRKELDDLKKKVEAKEPAPPASGKKAKPAKSK